MSRKITLATLSAALLLLAGCATMNEEECRSADWYSVGFEDGAHGRAINYIGNHREACAEYGISPQADRYQEGWNKGIRRYCTPRNGYQAGMYGHSVGAQCPADQARDFNTAYQYGKRIYLLNRELSDIDREMRKRQTEMDKVQQELTEIEHNLMGESRRDAEQERLHAKLRELYRREAKLEAQLSHLDRSEKSPKSEPGEEKENNKEKNRDKGQDRDNNRDKNRDRNKENSRDKENGRDKDKQQEKNNGKKEIVANNHRNEKQRKALKKELAAVRREIGTLEARLEQSERQQQNWKLLQRSRQLSLREGQLREQLQMLQQERMDLAREIDWRKQRAPY